MKQKLNKKLVKQLRDGKIAVKNDCGIKELKSLMPNECVIGLFMYYYFIDGRRYNTDNENNLKGLKVYSVKDFFKPAKLNLKDVDKPIWFPDAKKVFKYTKDVEFYGKLIVSNTPFFEDDYIDYKDIKWPKTKSSLEDRVTVLEKESAANKAANLLLGLQNVAVNAENAMLRQHKGVEKIVTPSREVKEPEFEKGGISFSESGKTEITIPESIFKEKEVYVNRVKQEPKEEAIDWSKPQLLYSDDLVVITNGEHNQYEDFTATVLTNTEHYRIGRIYTDFGKRHFKPFKGTITV